MTEYEVHMFLSSRSQAQDDAQPVVRAKPEDLDEAAIAGYIERFRCATGSSAICVFFASFAILDPIRSG